MPKIDYKDYVSLEELKQRGYNLQADGVLDDTHFENREDAINDFMLNVCNIIYNLVKEYRGRKWADAFFEDMKKTDLTGKALEYQESLHDAIIEQAIFTYDNGDSQSSASNEERKYNTAYAPKAVSELWDIVLCW